MSALRAALEDGGFGDVETYIQSGNVVFTPPKRAPADLRAQVERIIEKVAGYDVSVVVRTLAELRRTVARNPFPKASGSQLHVVFFTTAPKKSVFADLDLDAFAPEELALFGKDLYLHLPNGMGRAKLPVELDKALKRAKADRGTARNWNTVLKLVELAS